MMKKTLKHSALLAWAVVLPVQAPAEDMPIVVRLGEVVVEADKLVIPTRQPSETVYTGSEITKKGVELQGARASTSVSAVLDLLPGISFEGVDNNGLAAESGGLRIRGVKGALGALTIEGVPNYGGNPIGPRDYLYDMENMRAVSIYKGAAPGDIGAGVGSRGGAVELKPDWPHPEMGLQVKQSIGADSYSRTFLRFDSGEIGEAKTAFSGSFSQAEADKWRGPGAIGPRKNANLTFSQSMGQRFNVAVWYNHNDFKQALYRPLTQAEIADLGANYDHDYASSLTGVAARDISYYAYNRGEYLNDDILALLTLRVNDSLRFSLKPYYNDEDTEIYQGASSGGGRVQQRVRDIERTGVIGEMTLETHGFITTLGHHYESVGMDVYTRNYAIIDGGLAYRGYGVFASGGKGEVNSPFVKVASSSGPFDWQAGLKYFNFRDGAAKGYVTGPGPDYALVAASDLDRDQTTYDVWLPTAGVSWQPSDQVRLYANYGRNFIRPYAYMPLVNLYNSNRAAFQARNMDLQDLFNGYDIEKSDTLDLGFRYDGGWFEFAPTVFYSKHKDLGVTVYDPLVHLNYRQNMARATGHGVEMELTFYPAQNLTVSITPSYTSLTYDDDLVFAGSTIDCEGNQVVDTPQWQVKSFLIYHPGNFEIIPMFRYMGKRYSDLEHKGKVGSHFIADLQMSYTPTNLFGARQAKLALDVNNLFDKEYISVIDAWDDTRDGSASFYPGAPLSAMLSLSVQF